MKKIAAIFLLVIISNAVYSQRVFEYVDKTEGISVFVDKEPEIINSGGSQAGVTISCANNIPLSFESNVDKVVDVYKTEQKGALTYYHLRFIVGRYKGAIYDGRVLQVMSDNYLPIRIRLDLKPSESKMYDVFDPNVNSASGCFYQNFNEAAELFKQAMYEESLKKYVSSTDCADYQNNMGVMQKIDVIKSIISLRERADYFFNISNFKEALDAYQKIIGYNNEDQYAIARNKDALAKYSENCTNYYYIAENYFREGKYDEAKRLYGIIIEQSCSYHDAATSRLSEIRKIAYSNNKRERVVLYEYAWNAPIGVAAGRFEEKRYSGYFSIRTNIEFFQVFDKYNKKVGRPEINVSVGATKKVYDRLWLFAGVGYTGVGAWAKSSSDNIVRLHPAISPEVGVLYKLGPVALRYTFQYRLALEEGYHDHIGRFKHVGGIGFCF